MKTALAVLFYCGVGVIITLLSTFVGERSALATFTDIMGCEEQCVVAAAGWPLIFVSDYLGMSVVNTADIFEVWFAADRFYWVPFLINVGAWISVSLLAVRIIRVIVQRGSLSKTDVR